MDSNQYSIALIVFFITVRSCKHSCTESYCLRLLSVFFEKLHANEMPRCHKAGFPHSPCLNWPLRAWKRLHACELPRDIATKTFYALTSPRNSLSKLVVRRVRDSQQPHSRKDETLHLPSHNHVPLGELLQSRTHHRRPLLTYQGCCNVLHGSNQDL